MVKIKDNLGEFNIYLRKDRSLARLRLVDDGKFEEPEKLNDPWPKSQWSFACDPLEGRNTPAALLRPWSWLSSPRRLDRQTARQAAELIALTYPSTGASPSLPPIQPLADDKRKLPTAARPRGVRKHSPPPKLKPPPALDLRPYLASQAGTEYLLRLMDELGDGAMSPRRPSLPKSAPDIFYSRLLPLASDSAEAGKLYKTAMALRLENDEHALAAFCAIIVRLGVEFACRWSAPAQYLDKIGITGWLAMLAHLAPQWRKDALPPAQLAGFMKKNGGALAPWKAWFILGSLLRAASFDQIQQGYYLAEKMFPEYRLSPIGPRPGIDPEFIHYLARKSGVLEDHLARTLWQHGGELAGFADLLISFDWGNINKEAAKELLQGLIWRSYPWNVFYRPGVYDAVFNHRPYLAHGLRRLPIERQGRFVSIILLVIDCWSTAIKAGRSFQEAVDFALRLSLPPFPSSQVDFNLPCFFMMDRNGNKIDVSAIPDEAFVKILHALKNDNRGHLTTWGINRMIEHDAPRVMAAFSAHPAQTLKACFSLGLLSYAAAGELLSRFDGHEVHQLAHLPDAQMADAVLRLVAEGLQSPLPRKLREELEGKIRLTVAQRARAMQKTRWQLEAFKMNILEDLAQRKMRQAIGPAPRDEASVHAIMLAATVDENQRGLRRMLKRHFGGERDYARNHPLSQQWIKRLKKLKFDQWDAGVTSSRPIKDLGQVEISVEKDPLEILKMGSYFNTCLGIGGINSHSAAAVALDINKRVLYARAANGRAVARMLTAIDKQERLVCFSVYPHTASAELKIFFKDVARQWAATMGVSIYKNKKGADDYEIPGVLSQDWYDDGHWEKPANRSQSRSRANSAKR